MANSWSARTLHPMAKESQGMVITLQLLSLALQSKPGLIPTSIRSLSGLGGIFRTPI